MDAANAPPAESESRETSPSGEGLRLGDSSHIGLSSAFLAGQAHRVGDGGPAINRQIANPGAVLEGGRPAIPRVQIDEIDDAILPAYDEMPIHGPQALPPIQSMEMDEDEGVDILYGPTQPWNNPTWSFDRNLESFTSGRSAPSQMIAVPPASLDFNQGEEEDLFENAEHDGASTKAEGGDGSSMSDADERMNDLEPLDDFIDTPLLPGSRGHRAGAPPPLAAHDGNPNHNNDDDDDDDDMPVVELRVDDDGDGEASKSTQ